MRRIFFALALLTYLTACGGEKKGDDFSRMPVSVRGWVLDVKGAERSSTMEMELLRRQQLFQATSLWVENNQYASGGIAENGAFILLDVPPGESIVGFNAPGAETARLTLKDVPGTADVYVPDVILEKGGAKVLDPTKIQVRIANNVSKRTPTGQTALVGGYPVRVFEVPIAELTDRRDYPRPPGYRPLATVK
ncbi:MAG: hypothetical protein ABI779_00575 [Acidobacteriota bacterium]